MQRVISYEKISPAVLGSILQATSVNVLCYWSELDEDRFIFTVSSWLPMGKKEIDTIIEIINLYID